MPARAGIRRTGTLVFFVVLAAGAFFTWQSLARAEGTSDDQLFHALAWRVRLFARKATGGVPDLSWSELWLMTRSRGGFGLAGAITGGRSLFGSVENPYITSADQRAGAELFRDRCAACHGPEGTGWHGPPLNRAGLKQGDGDLAIYKVLRDGVDGTDMPAAGVSPVELWQLVGYVRRLQINGSAGYGGELSPVNIHVSEKRVLKAGERLDEWVTYSGSIDGRRYSPLDEITPANVAGLRLRWLRQLDPGEPTIEATPLVVDGVIFITEPPSNVVAMDVRTGQVRWRHTRHIAANMPTCCGRNNRGLAILGKTLYLATLDGYLVALNADTGEQLWQVQVASPSDGYTMTGAPLIANQLVITGVAGGEFGIRGFLAAYDTVSGEQRWRFDTIPGPGMPGHETWENEAWRTGGGPTWTTGSFDPALDMLYWGVGNPSPDFAGDVRPGDNLFSNSVIALKASTGKLVWHFQFTPHDEHDWDSNQTPILANLTVGGVPRQVLCWANRNGFYYVLDRVTGAFLAGTPYVELNWAKGLDENGRPVLSNDGGISDTGRLSRPGVAGGTNWQNGALDREKGLYFVHATEGASVFTKSPQVVRGNRGFFLGSAGSTSAPPTTVVRALDAATGLKKWEYFSPPLREPSFSFSGLLATAGGLVFGSSGGSVFAVNSANGEEKWRVFLGGDSRAAPITFTIDGQQVIAVSAGRSLFLFGL
jgi:alcohol dehydrogenase (cytochrome c)